MENHHVQWVNPLFLWSFSIAMLNYRRVGHQSKKESSNRLPTARVVGGSDSEPGAEINGRVNHNKGKPWGNHGETMGKPWERSWKMIWKMSKKKIIPFAGCDSGGTRVGDQEKSHDFRERDFHPYTHATRAITKKLKQSTNNSS